MNVRLRFAMLCLIVTSCSPETREGLDTITTDSTGVTVVSAESFQGLPSRTPSALLVDLASSQDSADSSFSQVGAILRMEDGRLVIADGRSRRLKVFGPEGTYLHTVAGPGGTPAELGSITAIWQSGTNRITAFDQRKQHVTIVSLDSGVLQAFDLSSSNPRARPVGRFDSGDVLVRSLILNVPETGFAEANIAVVRFGVDGAMADTIGIWRTARMGRLGQPPVQLISGPMFEPRFVAAAAGSRLLVSDCRSAEYRVIDSSAGLVQVVRWPVTDPNVTEDDIRLYRARRLAGQIGEQQTRMQGILDDMPVNPTLPACDVLRVDSAGNAWVRSFVRPGAQQQEWLVFDLEGRPLFRIELPVATRIMDLGTSHVTVIEVDSLNVERVRVYGIE